VDLHSGDIQTIDVSDDVLAYTRGNLLIVHNLTSKSIALNIFRDYALQKHFSTTQSKLSDNELAGYSTMIFYKK